MSADGVLEHSSIGNPSSPNTTIPTQATAGYEAARAAKLDEPAQHEYTFEPTLTSNWEPVQVQAPPKLRTQMRLQFDDFAAQLRLHRHHEHKRRLLEHRRRHLHKVVSLSARLHRVGGWVRDGLVEISKHADATGFVHVHHQMQDLVEVCFAKWTQELQAVEQLQDAGAGAGTGSTADATAFFFGLSPGSRTDLLELIHTLRSSPHFLVERFKALSPSQISALSTSPKYQDVSDAIMTSLSQSRGRLSQRKKIKAFSKGLEDYASSFERSNPLSFLLYNVYATAQEGADDESRLRLSTWSTICSELLLTNRLAYEALLNQILNAFAILSEWRVKDRVELFLMDTLQKGAFLLDLVQEQGRESQPEFYDPLGTPQAQAFFDRAVRELFEVLAGTDAGFPTGARQLASAILGKLHTVDDQSHFRGEFFSWFLSDFLRITITYPENENMLLQFHVSKSARDIILHHLWSKAYTRASDVFSPTPSEPIDPDVQYCVEVLVAQLVPREDCGERDEVVKDSTWPENIGRTSSSNSTITTCASEIVQVLEALSPQAIHTASVWDPFLTSSATAFNAQYSKASNRFDRLRREILVLTEPGRSSQVVHPCQEHWLVLEVAPSARPSVLTKGSSLSVDSINEVVLNRFGSLDTTQDAAIRLHRERASRGFDVPDGVTGDGIQTKRSLLTLFEEEATFANCKADVVSRLYWDRARRHLREKYPVAALAEDDTKILRNLQAVSENAQNECHEACLRLEAELIKLEDSYDQLQNRVSGLLACLDGLRIKLWYSVSVTASNGYEDAKNIAAALNNMALSLPGLQQFGSVAGSDWDSPPSSRSTTSSLFDQPQKDTMSILKAPREHGGPKKLADAQIELTKRWLQRNSIDNFCKGEERIHRFCMEVRIAVRKLVGESLSEGPILWSSELFARERNLYETPPMGPMSVPGSTRPPSILSEIVPSNTSLLRPGFRIGESVTRGFALDGSGSSPGTRKLSFHSLGSNRLSRDIIGVDLASSLSSPARATSATTAESISSVWSHLPSHARSATSASMQSRPASMFNDVGFTSDHAAPKFTALAREKAKFLDHIQQELTCLLLSDLGCPVWSCGSETDAWLEIVRATPSIELRLQNRKSTAQLLSPPDAATLAASQSPKALNAIRRHSISLTRAGRIGESEDPTLTSTQELAAALVPEPSVTRKRPYLDALRELLAKLGQHVNPFQKLQAVLDFKIVALTESGSYTTSPLTAEHSQGRAVSAPSSRRSSLHAQNLTSQVSAKSASSFYDRGTSSGPLGDQGFSEGEIIRRLKALMTELKPKTLFRDLQYIAAFVPSDVLNKLESGRAFLHFGLAALAYKDEVCRSMVDVADKIVARDSIKRRVNVGEAEQHVTKAAEYWIVAAREGNAIAQRELAGLYLTHPEVPPIVSLPMSLSSETFKSEMMWQSREGSHDGNPALCLALHWMQQAASNGDVVAEQKLKERQEGHSIR